MHNEEKSYTHIPDHTEIAREQKFLEYLSWEKKLKNRKNLFNRKKNVLEITSLYDIRIFTGAGRMFFVEKKNVGQRESFEEEIKIEGKINRFSVEKFILTNITEARLFSSNDEKAKKIML